jgi:hypothetical protein
VTSGFMSQDTTSHPTGIPAADARVTHGPRLTAVQAAAVERARQALAQDPPPMYELGETAARIAALEQHLAEMVELAAQLAGAR